MVGTASVISVRIAGDIPAFRIAGVRTAQHAVEFARWHFQQLSHLHPPTEWECEQLAAQTWIVRAGTPERIATFPIAQYRLAPVRGLSAEEAAIL